MTSTPRASCKDHYDALNQRAYKRMLQVFNERNHYPSPPQLKGLQDIQKTLSQMLSGEAQPLYYISSLDPGIGKSTAISTWLEVFISMSFLFPSRGVLLGLDRLDEILRFVNDCRISEDRYAVMVQDGAMVKENEENEVGIELNRCGLGKENATEAQILFTTKAQIQRRSCGKDFNDIEAFYYHGKPRAVRSWDEGFSQGTSVTINPNDFGKLLTRLGEHDRVLSQQVFDIMVDIRKCTGGDVYSFPELALTRQELLYRVKWKTDEERELADLLGQLSGQEVTIREYKNDQIVVDCVQAIPADFAPCLITDASGRVKEAYRIQHKYQQNVKELTTPDQHKSYRNLTVSVWKRSSSKIALLNDQEEVAREIVKIIGSRPLHEEFLLIRYLSQVKLEEAVMSNLPKEDNDRIKWLTWGRVTATNKYKDITNTIIVSPYYYREYAYESGAKAAGMRPTGTGGVEPDEIARFRKGEIDHHLLQALRGTGRLSEGDTCPETRLWMITNPQTGIIGRLSTHIYPGCKVAPWVTNNCSILTPLQQGAKDFILDRLGDGVTSIDERAVMRHVGIQKTCNFQRSVRSSEDFQEALKACGVEAVKQGKSWVYHLNSEPI